MKPHVENPALAGTGFPKSDLAGLASICSDNTASLPPIQADAMAERAFAYQLAAVVFGKPIVPVIERKRRRPVWRPTR